jgi:3-oxoacyl-[acyl-carrier-protein] synthase-3
MRISGLSEVLPGKPVTNRQMAERFGLHEQWLQMMTGNTSRYFCTDEDDGTPSGTGDLATLAGSRALVDAGLDPGQLDFLVLSTASPDHLMPATVNLVAERLGIDDVTTMQVTSGCAGAIQGLYVANALLAAGHKRGLVIGADCCLKVFPSASRIPAMRPAELINFALFGDGAGAAVVEADLTGPGLVLEHIFTRCIGAGRPPAQVIRYYGTEGAPPIAAADGSVSYEPWGAEDYKAIQVNVPILTEQIFTELALASGHDLDKVEHVLVPQLNGVMTEAIRQSAGVRPEQAVSCVAETGNNGNALPFIQLHRAAERISHAGSDGDRVFVANVESSKWLIAGLALRHQRQATA